MMSEPQVGTLGGKPLAVFGQGPGALVLNLADRALDRGLLLPAKIGPGFFVRALKRLPPGSGGRDEAEGIPNRAAAPLSAHEPGMIDGSKDIGDLTDDAGFALIEGPDLILLLAVKITPTTPLPENASAISPRPRHSYINLGRAFEM